jgi:hypothetical protein
MRKLLVVCGVVLLSSVAALAQDNIATVAAPVPAAALPAPPQVAAGPSLPDWQISIGYQFNRLNMPSASALVKNEAGVPAFTVNSSGVNGSFTRFFDRWGGIEAESGTGFGSGSIPAIKAVGSVFVGGGLRVAVRGHGRVEPWAHAVVGVEHFRFTQTNSGYGSDTSVAFVGGGGADFHVNGRTALRAQADFLETNIVSQAEYSLQIVGGVVFDF